MTEIIDEFEVRKTLVLHLIKGTIINVVSLLIDTLICWVTWTYIIVTKFNTPELSPWQMLGILYTFRILMTAARKKEV